MGILSTKLHYEWHLGGQNINCGMCLDAKIDFIKQLEEVERKAELWDLLEQLPPSYGLLHNWKEDYWRTVKEEYHNRDQCQGSTPAEALEKFFKEEYKE